MTSSDNSIYARVLRRLTRAVCRHPKWFIYPQLLLALLCALYTALGLKMDMKRGHLPGPHMKYQQNYLKFRQEFPGEDELVVVVESGKPERNRQFVERLAARVMPATNFFTDLFYKADLTTLGSKSLLLAPAADLESMRQSLHDYLPFIRDFTQATNLDSLFAQVNKEFRMAPAQATASTAALVKAVPFLERLVVQAQQSLLRPGRPPSPGVGALFGAGPAADQQIYVTLDQDRLFLLTVRPKDEQVIAPAIEQLRQLIQQTQVEVPGVDVGLTGGPVLDYDELRQSEHDSLVASIAALIICSLIFILAYRQLGRPLKAALCLLIGLAYTMGFTTLVIGHLNILTITFAPMLIGLAIDFGIHLITRYEEEMRNRRTIEEALFKAMVFTGQGIITGGFTTAAAFLAMALTHFKGIQEMGIISGGGLLLCLIPMMTTLPALLMRGAQNARDHQLGPLGHRRVRIEKVWLQHPALVVLVTLLLFAAGAWGARRVYFDYNLLHMQSQRLASVTHEKKLLQSGGRSVIFAAVVADSAQQAREYERSIKGLPAVARVESVAGLFTRDQSRKLELARAIQREVSAIRFAPIDPNPPDLQALSTTLWILMGYAGLAAEQAQKGDPKLAAQLRSLRSAISNFRRTLLSGKPSIPGQLYAFRQALFSELQRTFDGLKHQDTSGPLRPQDLPPALRDRFIGVTGKYLLQVYPKKDIWNHDNQQEFLEQLHSVVPPDNVTGAPVQFYAYTTLLKVSYEQAAKYALVAIALMVLLQFRSLLSVLLALLPVAIGSAWLLGYMGFFGVPFNPANIMTLPLVVGIGVTNGIQILNRFAEEQNPRILAKSTGKSVLVSGLTAISGFGTLILAQHQGIKSLGEVMSIGIAACMIAGLTCLPALLCLLMHRGWSLKTPAPGFDSRAEAVNG